MTEEVLLHGPGYLYFNIDEVSSPKLVKHLSRSDHFNFLLCQPAIAERLGLALAKQA